MQRANRLGFVVAVVCLGLLGCGNGSNLAKVSGKITYKGKPVTTGGVVFQPAKGQPASGVIGPDGSYSLTTIANNDGATVGRNQVRISSYEVRPATPENGNETSLGKSLIPEKYASFDTSGLTFEVKPGVQNDASFDLVDGAAPSANRPVGP